MHLAVGKFLVVSLVTLWGLPGFASDLVISGWPRPDQNMTADSVLRYTDDPLLGRLACPPLVRFNLAKKNFDHLILRQAKVDDGKWQLTLRNGIYWWSGDEVKASDLVQYLENHLATIVSYKGADLWQIPEFAAKTTGTYGVEVSWKKAPQFGPMVLAGVPLWRKHEATNQCAGL